MQQLEQRRLLANLGELGIYLVDHSTGLRADSPYVGQHVEVRASFVAEGLSPGAIVRVQRETANGVLYSEISAPPAWSGREVVERTLFTWTVPPTDAWVTVTLDPRGVVAESSEGDNSLTLTLNPQASTTGLGVPAYHSLPGARFALYLDFDGNYQEQFAGSRNVTTPAYDTDGTPLLLSAGEREEIRQIWARVAEDYAPFDLDVTTEAPRPGQYERFQRVAIGGASCDWYEFSAAGTALAGSFYEMDAEPAAFVFTRQANGDGTSYAFPLVTIADAVSHEAGHAFGLWHQAEYENGELVSDYHPGTGVWGPIMGRSGNPWSTWHNGPTHASATGYQDDMAVLTDGRNGWGYRTDDAGNDAATAKALGTYAGPGTFLEASGVIETNGDVDVYSATLPAGRYRFAANVASDGPNLDAVLELRDSAGATVAVANAPDVQSAAIEATVAAGTYYLYVRGTGAYGRVGQYWVAVGEPAAPAAPGPVPAPPVVSGPAPDLAANLASRTPKSVTTGTVASTVVTVENVGDVATRGAVTVKVFASRQADLGGGEPVLLGKAVVRGSIKSGTFSAVNVSLAYPAALETGRYYLVATVQGRGAELSAENNVWSSNGRVRVIRVAPKLSASVEPAKATLARQPWAASVAVRNEGTGAFDGKALVRLFASKDGVFGNEDDVLVGRATAQGRIGTRELRRVTVQARAVPEAGTYRVFAAVTQDGETVAARKAVKVRFV